MAPLFSIAIPAYKGRFLSEAIASCLTQTYSEFEIIIVNDASPEDLGSVVSTFNDSRIHYFKNDKNCGAVNVVDNWNICLSYAKGDYIICMGDDDKLLPNCLEEYSKLITKYPNLGVYHAWSELIDEESSFYNIQQPRPEYESALSLAWNRWDGRNKQYIGDFCFKVDLLRNNGGFYKLPMAWGSDDISAIIAARPAGIANTQVICFQYRVNRHTISNTGSEVIKIEAIILQRDWYLSFLNDIKSSNLNELDLKYLYCLECNVDKHFYDRLLSCIYSDMKHKPARKLLFWLKQSNHIGATKSDVLRVWFKAVAKTSLR